MSLVYKGTKHSDLNKYVTSKKKDKQVVRVTKAVCDEDWWTFYQLLINFRTEQILPTRREDSDAVKCGQAHTGKHLKIMFIQKLAETACIPLRDSCTQHSKNIRIDLTSTLTSTLRSRNCSV